MDYKIGMKVRGKVTGLQPYGAFVALDKETQGLIHISELKHGYVKSIEEVVNVEDEVDVIVLDVDEYTKKISLSMRCLQKAKHNLRRPRRNYPRYGNKQSSIGFQSLADNMPKWVDEGLEQIKKANE